ncbi:hypothetical protein Pmani_012962 [Petrolisthes manimaculis]|uniref:peptidyl-tRNA hydrolase n=1 Tax=Petrolisthes manimaculis TaxID=1843537 RepID=A0AAE1PY44_9EUCA|nr:hypothetical protein Pmani_012962 [Petrolisthes manimaculis]
MFRSACDFLASKAGLDNGSDEDSSKENSLVNGQSQFSPMPTPPKGSPPMVVGSPWGHTLTPRGAGMSPGHGKGGSLSQRLVNSSPSPQTSPPKQNVPWNDLSFAAEVVSPGFTSRVVREAQGMNSRSPIDTRRHYPTAQERYVRAGVLPNVRLSGRAKAILTPRRNPTSPLLPLGRASSASFTSSSLSSDFLASTTPRMPDIRSVASVLEGGGNSGGENASRDPTSVAAVVAALQQSQVSGKGVKRTTCSLEPEDLSKRQKGVNAATTPTATTTSSLAPPLPINYSRDYSEGENSGGVNMMGGSSNVVGTGMGGGGEKRALDLSPRASSTAGNNGSGGQQVSPESKRRCVLDPMTASFSSSKHLVQLAKIQAQNGRDTPFSLFDSRQDTDSESNPSVESGQSKSHQMGEGACGDPFSPGPSERDLTDRSGSHTPQSSKGDGVTGRCVGGGGSSVGTSNASRTSTPRNLTPPRPTHVISLDAYMAEKAKSQQRLKKMLGMLFHNKDGDDQPSPQTSPTAVTTTASSLPLSTSLSVPTFTLTPTTTSDSISTSSFPLTAPGPTKTAPEPPMEGEDTPPAATTTATTTSADTATSTTASSDGPSSEVSASYTFSLKPSNPLAAEKNVDSESKEKESDEEGDVSVTAVFKLPPPSYSESTSKPANPLLPSPAPVSTQNDAPLMLPTPVTSDTLHTSVAQFPAAATLKSVASSASTTSSSLVDFLKATSPAKKSPLSLPNTENNGGMFKFESSNPPTQLSVSTSSTPVVSFSSQSASISTSKDSVVITSTAEKLPPEGSQSNNMQPTPLVTSQDTSTAGGNMFSYGTTGTQQPTTTTQQPVASTAASSIGGGGLSGFFSNSNKDTPSLTVSSGGFTFGSGSSAFTPLTAKTDAGATPTPAPAPAPAPSLAFPFNATSVAQPFGSSTPASTPVGATTTSAPATSNVFSFGAQTTSSIQSPFAMSSTTTADTSASPFGGSSATATIQSPPLFPSSSQPFSFGQTTSPPMSTTTGAATTTATAPFTFGAATTQPSSSTNMFSFGSTATTTESSQPFSAAPVATQGNEAAPLLFNFKAASNTTVASTTTAAAPSLFTFGSSKTTTASAVPATDSSKSAGFTFGMSPVATTASTTTTTQPAGFTFPAVTTTTSATTTASSAGFTFSTEKTADTKPSATFNFGAAAKSPPNAFGSGTSPFSFPSNTPSVPNFGSTQGQGFGATTTTAAPTFGTSTTTFPAASAAAPTSAAPFGSSAFGSNPSATFNFGGGQTNAFGAATNPAATPAFGATTNPTPAPAFGATPNPNAPAPAFGAATNPTPTPAFGATSSTGGFGATQTPAFGAPTFGSDAAKPATFQFGQAATGTPTFGAAPTPTFGGAAAGTTPAFGGAASPPAGPVFQFGGVASTPAFTTGNSPATAPRRPRARVVELLRETMSQPVEPKDEGEKKEDNKNGIVFTEGDDQVDPVLLRPLISMGMDERLASKALVCTDNKSVDAALSWIAELGAEEMEALCGSTDHGSEGSEEWENGEEEEDDDETYYKMVFVVNTELSMGVGKVAAQVGHGALGLYRLLRDDLEKYEASTEEWEECGERKITLKGKDSQELVALQKKAEGLHLPTYLVQDAGRTQVAPGSVTVLAIFGDDQAVDEVTGHLKLL